MTRLIVLGISGSIGSQTLDIIRRHKRKFVLCGFSVGERINCVDEILKEFKTISFVVVKNKSDKEKLEKIYPHIKFSYGDDGLLELIKQVECDLVVNALVGFVGFLPTICALENGRDLALANKESLVVGGNLVNQLLKKTNTKLYPIDSEHVALAKCLKGNKKAKKLVLTASGGSFRDLNRNELENVTVEDALKHPSWNMGQKITIDCATMMNKGFEIIEAYHLFNFPIDKIDVLLHDESKIHSLVEFEDGSFLADIGPADMRIPISHALFRNKRVKNTFASLPLDEFGTFHFRKFDPKRYPCVGYAKKAIAIGGTMPAVLNGANEEAVYAFLRKEIKFLSIEKIIEEVMERHEIVQNPTVQDLVDADKWAREEVRRLIKENNL
ncbi:MAG: 1-deoxy-D-xylulose-5-phosphate reductoisomerase [Erysipelotrichales bacterium]|nr:1-deoxy-D-xylulose-5-phosphate reductoisomerase [Erysipelotrichales bacterium]